MDRGLDAPVEGLPESWPDGLEANSAEGAEPSDAIQCLPPIMLIYRSMLESFVNAGTPAMTAWTQRGWRMLRELPADDPQEEIISAQIVLCEARLAHLQHFALRQTTLRNIRAFHEMCNNTITALARLVKSLDNHRRPRRRSYFSVRNANIAQRQVVKSIRRRRHAPRLETSPNLSNLSKETEEAPPISPDASGPRRPVPAHRPDPALEKEHRPENDHGETDLQPERA
jgi:hypothetical protein